MKMTKQNKEADVTEWSYAEMWNAMNTCNSCDYVVDDLNEEGYCDECQAKRNKLTKEQKKLVVNCLQEIKMELQATEQMLIARHGIHTAEIVMTEIHKKIATLGESN